MRSSSERASCSAPFAEDLGSGCHVVAAGRGSSCLDCWSGVRGGGVAGLQPSAGWGNGPIADMVGGSCILLLLFFFLEVGLGAMETGRREEGIDWRAGLSQ